MSRKIRALTLASLLLNVLAGGIILGHVLKVMGRDRHVPETGTMAVDITDTKLADIQTRLHIAHNANQDLFELVDKERNKTLDIIVQVPFDETSYQLQVDTIHELRGQAMQRIADEVKTMIAQLDSNERTALAELLGRPPPAYPASSR